MNREARKANLRKLQLPGSTKNTKNARETRSATISNYFASPNIKETTSCTQELEELNNINSLKQDTDVDKNILNEEANSESVKKVQSPAPPNLKTLRKRTKLSAFLYNSDKISVDTPEKEKHKNCNDFETPKKKIKKPPKLKDTKKTIKVLKKQPKIKSAFLRNEQIFSEITAQHCVADNFNPDEVQLALALSKSEVEKVVNYNDDIIVDLISDDTKNLKNVEGNETIRTRLQKYGFRTAAREDYSKIAAALMPGAYRRTRSKWANKFTALTLRNIDIQQKKLKDKIDALLKKQVKPQSLCREDGCAKEYLLVSNNLRKLQASADNKIVQNEDSIQYVQIENYFVKELFNISYLNAGHLLKDWNAIQGRDLTPCAKNSQSKIIEKTLYKAYNELEKYLTKTHLELKSNKNYVLNEHPTALNQLVTVESPAEITTEKVNMKSTKNQTQNSQTLVCKSMPSDNSSIDCADHITTKLCNNTNEIKLDNHTTFCAANIIDSTQASVISETTKDNNLISNNAQTDQNYGEKLIKILHSPIHFDIPDNDNMKTNLSITTQNSTSPIKEPPHKKLKQIQNIISPVKSKSTKYQIVNTLDKILNTQFSREKSPDLFADSDEDFEQENKSDEFEMGTDQNKSKESSHGITVYEIFSSDEVKTTDIKKNESPEKAPLIDLTANADDILEFAPHKLSPIELPLKGHNHKLVALNFTLSDSILIDDEEFGESTKNVSNKKSVSNSFVNEMDKSNNHDTDVYDVNEEVFNELVNKYLRAESNQIKKRQSVSLTQLPRVKKHFNLYETATSRNIISNKNCCVEPNTSLQSKKTETHSFKKSLSFTMNPIDDMCIDLTQNSDDDDNDGSSINMSASKEVAEDNECLILSDDEINYSIWQADRTANLKNDDFAPLETEDFSLNSNTDEEKSQYMSENFNEEEFEAQRDQHEFSILDIVNEENSDNQYKETSTFECETEPILEQFLKTTLPIETRNINDISKERFEFGIMDSYSEPFTQSPLKTPSKTTFDTKQLLSNASFLQSPGENFVALKRYSSTGTNKFSDFLKKTQEEDKNDTDDFDEFDKLVYDIPNKNDTSINEPSGMNKLLTAKLNFSTEAKTDEVKINSLEENITQEVHVNSKVYSVRLTTAPKPDFLKLTEAELLKQLYNFGIKPLKRKQAVKMLEYIYNQTHPLILDEVSETAINNTCNENDMLTNKLSQTEDNFTQNALEERKDEVFTPNSTNGKIILQDSSGSDLLRFSQKLCAELDDEVYILQTNVTKKTQQPLLPFHIAWFNLVCANPSLHEAILMFQPIDLQDVYLFLKNLGYRYDPKELKIFFDKRCIIFRYDLTAAAGKPSSGSNRQVRKAKSKNKNNSKTLL